MQRVLIAPCTFTLSNKRYGKNYNILNHLEKSGYHIDAYVSEVENSLNTPAVSVHEFKSRNKLSYFTASFWKAYREIQRGNVDIYHHMNLSYGWFNPVFFTSTDVPSVVGPCQTSHAVYPEEFKMVIDSAIGINTPVYITRPLYSAFEALKEPVIDPVRLSLFRWTLKGATRVVVVHNEAKEVYSDFVDESKIEVIPLGVDPEMFSYSERTQSADLVAIGALKRRKGYDVLFKSLPDVIAEIPDTHLHIFGDGSAKAELENQARELGVRDSITFHGYVNQSTIRRYLKESRLFVHPSRSESFSLVRLEAMASGCPVVVTDIAGATEMVRDGEEGYVVPVEDPEALATAMKNILVDFELAKQMGRKARDRVEQRYDWRRISQEYLDLYAELS